MVVVTKCVRSLVSKCETEKVRFGRVFEPMSEEGVC